VVLPGGAALAGLTKRNVGRKAMRIRLFLSPSLLSVQINSPLTIWLVYHH
jgi:hypothetical protein